jgi:hypothetical protein
MDFQSRSTRTSRREKVRNEIIREKMDIKNKILSDIWPKQIIWYGHLQRVDEERLPQLTLSSTPTRKSKRGRRKPRWKEGLLRAVK